MAHKEDEQHQLDELEVVEEIIVDLDGVADSHDYIFDFFDLEEEEDHDYFERVLTDDVAENEEKVGPKICVEVVLRRLESVHDQISPLVVAAVELDDDIESDDELDKEIPDRVNDFLSFEGSPEFYRDEKYGEDDADELDDIPDDLECIGGREDGDFFEVKFEEWDLSDPLLDLRKFCQSVAPIPQIIYKVNMERTEFFVLPRSDKSDHLFGDSLKLDELADIHLLVDFLFRFQLIGIRILENQCGLRVHFCVLTQNLCLA